VLKFNTNFFLYFFCSIAGLFLFITCSHKEVKEIYVEPIPVVIVEKESDYSNDMIVVYKKLVSSIKKRDIDGIMTCYSDVAQYSYSDTVFSELRCYNNELNVTGVDTIRLQYGSMFRKKYLDSIEYEIINVNNSKKQLKIINLWANSDYGVYEYLHFDIIDGKFLIDSHSIVKERKGAKG